MIFFCRFGLDICVYVLPLESMKSLVMGFVLVSFCKDKLCSLVPGYPGSVIYFLGWSQPIVLGHI